MLRSSHFNTLVANMITHISTVRRIQSRVHSHTQHAVYHHGASVCSIRRSLPQIASNHWDRQISIELSKKTASFARPARSVQASNQAGRQKLRACRSPRPTCPLSKPLANRTHLHAIKGNLPSHSKCTGRAVHAASIRDHTTTSLARVC
jgi:hypothetical protein